MPNILESYLVGLGFDVSQPELRKFQDALRTAGDAVKHETSGIARSLIEWQTGILGVFASISGAVVGLADHVAMADQNFRLFGLRMMMGQQDARALKMAMDALGQPLEVIAFDPETHRRFEQLQTDIRGFGKELGPTFEKNMLAIRNFRFEFTRLKVALQFLGMKFVSDLFDKFGLTVGQVKAKLEGFLTSLKGGQLNRWANELATEAVPVLKDFWQMLKAIGGAIGQAAVLFSNLVGLVSGDSSIEGASFSFEKIAEALQHALHWGAEFFQILTLIERALGHVVSAAADLLHLRLADAGKQLLQGVGDIAGALANPMGGAAGGGALGAFVGSMVLPGIGTWAGGLLGAKLGSMAGAEAEPLIGNRFPDLGPLHATMQNNREALVKIAQAFGVRPALMEAVAKQESGERQFDAQGNVVNSGKALGEMQLTPQTAKNLGVNPNDATQNLIGGAKYLRELMNRYHGNIREALAAYNAGPGKVDAALKSYGSNWMRAMPMETQRYVPSVTDRMQKIEVGSIQVHVTPGASPERTYRESYRGVQDALRAQTRRDVAQLSPGY